MGLVSAALLTLACLACASDPAPVNQPLAPTCLCTGGTCPVTVCDLQIEVLAKSCLPEGVRDVEILLGGHLEPASFQPGFAQRTCGTIARGQSAMLHARADQTWQWSQSIACPPAQAGDSKGPTLVLPLNCRTAP